MKNRVASDISGSALIAALSAGAVVTAIIAAVSALQASHARQTRQFAITREMKLLKEKLQVQMMDESVCPYTLGGPPAAPLIFSAVDGTSTPLTGVYYNDGSSPIISTATPALARLGSNWKLESVNLKYLGNEKGAGTFYADGELLLKFAPENPSVSSGGSFIGDTLTLPLDLTYTKSGTDGTLTKCVSKTLPRDYTQTYGKRIMDVLPGNPDQTFAVPDGVTALSVETWGGGGGGGHGFCTNPTNADGLHSCNSVAAQPEKNFSCTPIGFNTFPVSVIPRVFGGAGGGSGGYKRMILNVSAGSLCVIRLGLGGTGAAAAQNSGGNGSDTSVTCTNAGSVGTGIASQIEVRARGGFGGNSMTRKVGAVETCVGLTVLTTPATLPAAAPWGCLIGGLGAAVGLPLPASCSEISSHSPQAQFSASGSMSFNSKPTTGDGDFWGGIGGPSPGGAGRPGSGGTCTLAQLIAGTCAAPGKAAEGTAAGGGGGLRAIGGNGANGRAVITWGLYGR